MSGSTPLSKPRNDFMIVQFWTNIARFLAFTPLNIQSDSKHLTSKIYPMFLSLLYLTATLFSFYERFSIYKMFNVSQVILDSMQGVVESILIEFIVVWSVLRKNRWARLIKRMTILERKIIWNSEVPVKDSDLKILKLKIFLYHLAYVATHVFDSITNWTDMSYSLAFVIFRITSYYIMFSTIFVMLICTWLKNKYLFLEHFLKESVGRSKFTFVILDEEPGYSYYDKLKEFSTQYRNLYLIVQDFNGLFGYQFFFISICTILEILNAVNYGMPTVKNVDTMNNNIFVNVLYWIFYTACNTGIVMACDSVEKCGSKLRKTCLILHENSKKIELKEHLYMLTNYVQGLSPEFSAAGFWLVNQRVLSTLFSSMMTYLIVIIQFNITLQ